MIDTERIEFEGSTGQTLAARLDRPAGHLEGYALIAHCFSCSKDMWAVERISKRLADERIATLRFDFTGLGHSEGEFANTNFSSNVGDLVAAANYLEESDAHMAPSLLVGHSLGGAAALFAAHELPHVEAVATIAAPCDPAHVRHVFDDKIQEIEEEGEAEVTLAGRTFRIKEQFLNDLEDQRAVDRIGELDKPLMIFHGPLDNTVGIEHAARIFEAARHPKSFVSLDDANHLLTRRADAEYVANVLAGWARRYLPGGATETTEPRTKPDLDHAEVLVTETDEGRFTNDVFAGRHYLRADEPKEAGGDDTGPDPYGLLSAALGACTSMTLRMYADRKGWELDSVDVRLSHQKIHAKDCDHCDQTEGKVDRIERRLTLEGDLDDEQRQRLAEIADKCPVHRTLHRENDVVTVLADAE
jgi:putative redox protein